MFLRLRCQKLAGNKSVEGQVFIHVQTTRLIRLTRKGQFRTNRVRGNRCGGRASRWEKAMNDTQSAAPLVRFGTFEVNLHSRELRKHGMRIRLEEKPFQILELLLERAGHVVTRRALREKLWPDTV